MHHEDHQDEYYLMVVMFIGAMIGPGYFLAAWFLFISSGR